MEIYDWGLASDFKDRDDELAALDEWWADSDRLRDFLLYGRRRVGKSWLFRRFAHGKPALVLVVRSESAAAQFGEFADALEPVLGVRPEISGTLDLIRACYRAGRGRDLLVVIDEFQNLLPTDSPSRREMLDGIRAVMEDERDQSRLRLMICGSAVRVLDELRDEGNPLYGRFRALRLSPIPFRHSGEFLSSLSAVESIERYAIAGGAPQYLTIMGRGDITDAIVQHVVGRFGSLHDEVRTILSQELNDLRIYFSILSQLAAGPKEVGSVASALNASSGAITPHLEKLVELYLITRVQPIGAAPKSRNARYQLLDPFVRFWFRFIFPFQDEIAAGLNPSDHTASLILPGLADHVAPVYEEICRQWVRGNLASVAHRVGVWWGPSAHATRNAAAARQSEEIDIVGLRGATKTVTVVGECRWRSRPMDREPLYELKTFKLPALVDAGFKISKNCRFLLFSRSGFLPGVEEEAAIDPRVRLVSVDDLLAA